MAAAVKILLSSGKCDFRFQHGCAGMDRILYHRDDCAGVLQARVGHRFQNQRRAAACQVLYRTEAAGMFRAGGGGGAAVCCAGAVIGDGKPGIERLAGDFARNRMAAEMPAVAQSNLRHDLHTGQR